MKALIFDLDGTLIDSVYPHALAWQRALAEIGWTVPAWEIHRRIGISGRLLLKALARERARSLSEAAIRNLENRHAVLFSGLHGLCKPLPGAVDLLRFLRKARTAHGIATTGKRREIAASLRALKLGRKITVIDGSSVERAKPEPDLFVKCQSALAVDKSECVIVGDAVWDIHAARRRHPLRGGSDRGIRRAGAL